MAVLWNKKYKCWYIDIRIKLDNNTRIHTSYMDVKNPNFKSKTYVKRLEPTIIEKKKAELFLTSSKDIKLKELAKLFIEDYKLEHAESSTKQVNELLKNHILPVLNEDTTCENCFTINNMMRLRKSVIENKNIGNSHKSKIIRYTRMLTNFAKKMKAINSDTKDDCLSILELPRNKIVLKEPQNKYTPLELFLNAVEQNNDIKKFDKNSLIIFYFLGCRIGEYLGITRNNFEYNKDSTSFIYINKQLDYKGKLTNTLKTETSYKKIPLNDLCVSLLLENIKLKKIKNKERIFNYSRTSFRRIVNKVLKDANLPHNTLHGLGRKSINTELYLAGADDKVRQTLLGQKDKIVNIENYIDNEKALEKGADFLNEFVKKKA